MLPRDIRLQVTSRCNHFCAHCFASSNDATLTPDLDDNEFLFLFDQILHSELEAISFTGGEPLIRKYLILQILEKLQSQSVKKTLNTNGWFLTKPLASGLSHAGLDVVQVSLDSCDMERHDTFRGMKGSFDRALIAIENSVEVDLETHVRTTITPLNYIEMPDILNLALSKNADRLVVKPLIRSGRGALNNQLLTPEQQRRAVGDLLNQIHINPDIPHNYVQFLTPSLPFLIRSEVNYLHEHCDCGEGLAFITSKGDVQPCGYAHIVLGNLLEDSLQKIWSESRVLRTWREKRLNGKCVSCNYREICRGGCRASAYEASGSMSSVDPICWWEGQG